MAATSLPLPRNIEIGVSPKVQQILDGIGDAALRVQVEGTVKHSLQALADLGRIHLPQDQFEEQSTPSEGERHPELTPYVMAAVKSVNQLLQYLAATFPAPAGPQDQGGGDDFDLEFDLVDGPTGDGVGLTHRADEKKVLSPRDQVADAAYSFGSMLRSRMLEFARRLELALQKADPWPMLAELDDNQHRLLKNVQAVLFGVLGVFSDDARREEILPQYRSAITESVALRRAIADLTFQIGRFNDALASASPDTAVALVVGVADRLARFAGTPEYRTLRADDKKAVIDFRQSLYDLRRRKDGLPMVELRHAVEGFSKFLESMSAINHREVLVLHDRQRLEDCLRRLERADQAARSDANAAAYELKVIVNALTSVIGRNPHLDDAIRHFFREEPAPHEIGQQIEHWRSTVQSVLMTVG